MGADPVGDRESEYRRETEECLRLARETDDPRHKALLLEMGIACIEFAEQAKARKDQRHRESRG
jgi:hypothetical protein